MSKTPLRFVILASGTGSNARALIDHAQKSGGRLLPVALISDRAGIPALAMARERGVPTFVIDHRNEQVLLATLDSLQPSWACLAGYKRIVGKNFLEFFYARNLGFSRVLNVHPSLLPEYPGLHGYERAWKDGKRETGVTVHLVDSGLDTGPVVLQENFEIRPGDTLAQVEERGHEVEHRIFTRALEMAAAGEIRGREGR